MILRMVVIVNAFIVIVSTHSATAQEMKLARIGLLRSTTITDAVRNNNAFRQGLRKLGYIEGKNILIEYRYAMGETGRLPKLAAELVDLKVDVIVTGGDTAISAATKATSTIPIVAGYSSDPVGAGLVSSLSHPGGNFTGMTNISTDLAVKRLQIFLEIIGKPSKIAMVWPSGPVGRGIRSKVSATKAAARQFGVELQSVGVKDPKEFKAVYARMIKDGVRAVVIIQSPFTNAHVIQLMKLTNSNLLPSMCETGRWTIKGCLVSYGPNVRYMFRRAATYVDKILKGAKPADLPIEQTTRYKMAVNLKTAKALDINIPRSVLLRATEVIE
jgi:putative ABC transport system substrate-binding protein